MAEATASLETRPAITRRILRYGGWGVLALVIAVLLLSPARTGRVSYVTSEPEPAPTTPATTVATAVHPPDPNLFTAENMGDAWPFAGISSASVECRKGMAVIIADNGTTYALDAAANRAARTGDEDFIKIDAVLRTTSDRSKTKMSLAPLLDRAAQLCR
jgi:hypothetical protein